MLSVRASQGAISMATAAMVQPATFPAFTVSRSPAPGWMTLR